MLYLPMFEQLGSADQIRPSQLIVCFIFNERAAFSATVHENVRDERKNEEPMIHPVRGSTATQVIQFHRIQPCNLSFGINSLQMPTY